MKPISDDIFFIIHGGCSHVVKGMKNTQFLLNLNAVDMSEELSYGPVVLFRQQTMLSTIHSTRGNVIASEIGLRAAISQQEQNHFPLPIRKKLFWPHKVWLDSVLL